MKVYSIFIHNYLKLETTQIYTYWRRDKPVIICQYKGTLLSNKDEQNLVEYFFYSEPCWALHPQNLASLIGSLYLWALHQFPPPPHLWQEPNCYFYEFNFF